MNNTVPCKACGQPMLWATTRNNKRIPLDALPVEGGNVLLYEDGTAQVMSKKDRQKHAQALFPLPTYKSHFVTCPKAQSFRQSKE